MHTHRQKTEQPVRQGQAQHGDARGQQGAVRAYLEPHLGHGLPYRVVQLLCTASVRARCTQARTHTSANTHTTTHRRLHTQTANRQTDSSPHRKQGREGKGREGKGREGKGREEGTNLVFNGHHVDVGEYVLYEGVKPKRVRVGLRASQLTDWLVGSSD